MMPIKSLMTVKFIYYTNKPKTLGNQNFWGFRMTDHWFELKEIDPSMN